MIAIKKINLIILALNSQWMNEEKHGVRQIDRRILIELALQILFLFISFPFQKTNID